MNKIPTAEQFLQCCDLPEETATIGGIVKTLSILIEFAQLHIEAALKAAAEKSYLTETGCRDGRVTMENCGQLYFVNNFYDEDNEVEINKDSILNAYPKENIQ